MTGGGGILDGGGSFRTFTPVLCRGVECFENVGGDIAYPSID